MQKKKTINSKAGALKKANVVAGRRGFQTLLRRHFWASLSLGFSAIICLVSVVCVYISLKAISVTHTLKVAGVLQAIEQSVPVQHDRGGIINNVFVTDGEVVREGQILASLNTDDLQTELISARQEVAGLLLRTRCVRALKNGNTILVLPEQLKQVLGQLQQIEKMERDVRKCRVELEQNRLSQSFMQAELDAAHDLYRLHARLEETNQLINDSGRKLDPYKVQSKSQTLEDFQFMKQVLIYSIDANKAKIAYKELKLRLERDHLAEQRAYDAELERISDVLASAQSELTRMESLLRDKFIYATASGRVQRMRIRESGRRVAAGAHVLEIAPLTTDFEVTSSINIAQAPNLNEGQLVHVKLSGGLPKPIWVPARIEKILKTSENNRLLSIRLAREDLNKRDLLLGDHSLNGLGERSEAIISIRSETAWESLSGTVKGVFLSNDGRHEYDA